jgi:hypothetical protein
LASIAVPDGVALCCMFHRAIRGQGLPKYSARIDPPYRFHQWQANLHAEVTEIKTVPVLLSHPFVERLIGRWREYLDRTILTTVNLMPIQRFQLYYSPSNACRLGRRPARTGC